MPMLDSRALFTTLRDLVDEAKACDRGLLDRKNGLAVLTILA